jgi:hypothetical protein
VPGTEEEEEAQVEASLDELIAKKADRPSTAEDDEEDEEALVNLGRDDARESLSTKVLPVQDNEFICTRCYLVKHRSQLADRRRVLCRDCA